MTICTLLNCWTDTRLQWRLKWKKKLHLWQINETKFLAVTFRASAVTASKFDTTLWIFAEFHNSLPHTSKTFFLRKATQEGLDNVVVPTVNGRIKPLSSRHLFVKQTVPKAKMVISIAYTCIKSTLVPRFYHPTCLIQEKSDNTQVLSPFRERAFHLLSRKLMTSLR